MNSLCYTLKPVSHFLHHEAHEIRDNFPYLTAMHVGLHAWSQHRPPELKHVMQAVGNQLGVIAVAHTVGYVIDQIIPDSECQVMGYAEEPPVGGM